MLQRAFGPGAGASCSDPQAAVFRALARWHGTWVLGCAEPDIANWFGIDRERLITLAEQQRAGALLFDLFDPSRGRSPGLGPGWEHLEHAYYSQAAANIMLLSMYARISAVLRDRGIVHAPLKGVDLVCNIYKNIALRPMQDIDLLVRPEDARQTADLLSGMGLQPLRGRGMPERVQVTPFLNSRYFVDESEVRLAVHLHWHLLNTSVPRERQVRALGLDRLWSRLIRDEATGGLLLSPLDRFLHLCDHALKHSFGSMMHWVDLALILYGGPRARGHVELDPEAVVAEARATGRETAVALAVAYVRDLLGVPVPEGLRRRLRRVPRGWVERWFDRRVRSGRSSDGLCVLVYGAEEPDWRSRLRFLWRSLAPPPEALGVIDLPDHGGHAGWRDYAVRAGSALRLAGRVLGGHAR